MAYTIRPFTTDHIDFALAQTTREGWDTTREEFVLALEHDPEGCYIAEVDGEPAALITSTRFQRSGWVGNLIVSPDYRRRGLGEQMMHHALRYLEEPGDHPNQLEADPMGVGIYRRLGFVDRFQSLRFRSHPPHKPLLDEPCNELTVNEVPDLLPLDSSAYGDDRSRLLAGFVRQSRKAYVVTNDGTVNGYAVVNSTPDGVRFGPWVAQDEKVAAQLLDRALHDFEQVSVSIGVPEINDAAVEILSTRQFAQRQPCLRMVRGGPIDDRCSDRLFAIANGAVG